MTNTMEWETKVKAFHNRALIYGGVVYYRKMLKTFINDLLTTARKEALHAQALSYRKMIEGMKKKVPEKQNLDEMALTLTNLELAEKAIEFHAWNDALAHLIQEMEKTHE
jgi:hypothetical protein